MSTKDLIAEMTENVNKYGGENATTYLMVQAIQKLSAAEAELASLRSELEAARGKVEALTKSTYHMGACITDDTLHATVMRRGPDGMVHVLLSEKVPVDILQNHDVIMGALHPQALTRPAVPDAKAMANRLMGWKLPKNFSPDCFISFDRAGAEACGAWPVGTNLFTVDQATEMFEYVLAAVPHP